MVLSASSVLSFNVYGDTFYIFKRQAAFAALGVVGMMIASRLPIELIRRSVYWSLGIVVVLICATLIPGIGQEVGGNRNWLPLFAGFNIQPSEFVKLAIVLWVADLYARKERLMNDPKHVLIPMVPITVGISVLVIMQKDLGTAVVLFSIIIGLLWVAGLPAKFMGSVFMGLAVVALALVAAAPHRVARLTTFLDPMSDPDNTGFQSVHGLMALATGQFWGVGLGASRQKWGTLPEAHTDFIFAVIGEELGLFGTLIVLALFLMLAYTGVRIASRTKDPFIRYAAAGITIWIMSQTVINIAMVLGMLPVIGLPLPLISYGGSSLLTTLVAMGFLLNFAKREPGAKRALAAGRKRRKVALKDQLPRIRRV